MKGDSSVWKRATALALAGVAIRALVMLLLPDGAMSIDLVHWAAVAGHLSRGDNPYAATTHLNWPPLWMQIIFLLHKASIWSSIEFSGLVRYFLIGVDAINIALSAVIAIRYLGVARPERVLIAGLVANPVSILLVCQHGNFDVLMVTALLAFAIAILHFRETHDAVDWLSACFALGIGVLTKTVPLFLAPLLAFRSSSLQARARILGALLLVTPVAVGMSVIYVLKPVEVTANVLRYRSYVGYFGITGLLDLAGLSNVALLYSNVFPFLTLAGVVSLGVWLRSRDLAPVEIPLVIATLLTALIAFGPGFGTQYLAWCLPFWTLTFFSYGTAWRRDLSAAWITAGVTYLADYAINPSLGHFLVRLAPSSSLLWRMSDIVTAEGVNTLMRLPLWAAMLWLVFAGARQLSRHFQGRDLSPL